MRFRRRFARPPRSVQSSLEGDAMTTTTASAGLPKTREGKYVYLFGGGKADGNADMKQPARRQGRRPGRDDQPRHPGTARLHDHHRGLHRLLRERPPVPRRPRRAGARRRRLRREPAGAALRRPREAAARLRALRRPRLDARHDGHRAQPRPERRRRRGPGARDRRRALRLRLLPPLRPDVRRRRPGPQAARARKTTRSRRILEAKKHARGVAPRHRADRRSDLRELVVEFKDEIWKRKQHRVPRGPLGAALGRGRRRLRLLGEPARRRPTAACTTSPADWGTAVNVQAMVFGNLGDDCATGVAFTRDPSTGDKRFYGEYLVNAQGEDVVAGIRTPQPVTKDAKRDRPGLARRARCRRPTPSSTRRRQIARAALPRHAGHRVHDPAGQALAAADPQRQAHRQGDGQDRRRPGGRGPDHARKRRSCASSRTSSTSCCTPPSTRPRRRDVIAIGLPASPGAAVGKVVFSADDAVRAGGRRASR